jgi:hypothetical protein
LLSVPNKFKAVKYSAIIYLLFIGLSLKAQDTATCPCQKELSEAFETGLKGQVYTGLPGMVGTEFFNQSYVNGDIILEHGEVVKNQQIRYNGRIDGVLLLPPHSSLEILLDKYFIKGFCLKNFMGKAPLCFSKIKVINGLGGDSIQIFGQILYHNKLSLYAYRQYVYQQDVLEDIGNTKIAKKQYGPSFIYYFQLPNGKTIGFKKFKKRDLYKVFPQNKELMKKLFKENHQRRFRNEDDLVRITEILNSFYN